VASGEWREKLTENKSYLLLALIGYWLLAIFDWLFEIKINAAIANRK
jgi:hypothetical protein